MPTGRQQVPPISRVESYGWTFRASKRFTGVADASTSQLFIDNGSNSGVDLYIQRLITSSEGLADIDVNTNVTQDTSGTSLTIHNDLAGSSNSSAATVEHGGSYSSRDSNPYTEIIQPGGSAGVKIGGVGQEIGFVLPQGNNLLVEVTNQSGTSSRQSILAKWVEVDA